MSDSPDKTLAERVAALREMAGRMTPARWEWWTSNSVKRLSHERDGDVLYAYPHDSGADVAIREADMVGIVALRNEALPVIDELSAEVERLRACERDAERYREVRKWTPVTFMNATQVNLKTGKPFDEIVDDLMPFTDAAIAREGK